MRCLSVVLKTLKKIFIEEEDCILDEPWSDQTMLEEVHKEWQAALQFFDEASDPELVEYAVYNLRAIEKKYGYLLKRVRAQAQTSPDSLPPRPSRDSLLIKAVL